MLIAVDLESWGWQLDGQFFTGVWERQSWETSLCRRVLRMVLLSSWHRAKTNYIMHQISFSWTSLLGLNGIQYTVYGYIVFDLELKAQVQVYRLLMDTYRMRSVVVYTPVECFASRIYCLERCNQGRGSWSLSDPLSLDSDIRFLAFRQNFHTIHRL